MVLNSSHQPNKSPIKGAGTLPSSHQNMETAAIEEISQKRIGSNQRLKSGDRKKRGVRAVVVKKNYQSCESDDEEGSSDVEFEDVKVKQKKVTKRVVVREISI